MSDWSVRSGDLPKKTFLFTDIEASTRRWEEDPAEMAGSLARHDELLDQVIDANVGVLFKPRVTVVAPCSILRAPLSARP
jgi:class 3 adenylate cyclase